MWLVNTEMDMITHMIEVEKGEEHNDTRPDGSPKRKYKYPIVACYKLNEPILSKITIKGFDMRIRDLTNNLTKVWAIRDDRL